MSAHNQEALPLPPAPAISEALVEWLELQIPKPFVPKLDVDERKVQRLYGRWELIAQLRHYLNEQQNPTTYEDDVPDAETT